MSDKCSTLHAAGKLIENSSNPWSIGCLTIAVSDYYEFGVNAGFIESRHGIYNQNYEQVKTLGDINFKQYDSWGYVVVNRDYMEVTEKRKFLYEDNNNETY